MTRWKDSDLTNPRRGINSTIITMRTSKRKSTRRVIVDAPDTPITNPIRVSGKASAPILVVCEAPDAKSFRQGKVMSDSYMKKFLIEAKRVGLDPSFFCFITACSPIPPEWSKSQTKITKHLKEQSEAFLEKSKMATGKKLILCLGANASRQIHGRAIKITKARGQTELSTILGLNALTIYTIGYIKMRPEAEDIFISDMETLRRIVDAEYDMVRASLVKVPTDYKWACDLSDLLENPPAITAFDIEGVGLEVMMPNYRILCAQITTEVGNALLIPTDREYYNDALACHYARVEVLNGERGERDLTDAEESITKATFPMFTDADFDMAEEHLKEYAEREDIKKVGHNLKFDCHAMMSAYGVSVNGWVHDTLQMAFAADENMMSKSLSECVRRWVSPMAGYCLGLGSRVLTSDLRHVKVEELVVGDELLAFDEFPESPKKRRKMRKSYVTACQKKVLPCFRIQTSMGRDIVVSSDHMFLNKNFKGGQWGWRKANTLKVGNSLLPFPWETPREDFSGGYMSAMYDGEGYVTVGATNNGAITGMRIGVTQNEGDVLDRVIDTLSEDGFSSWVSVQKDKRGSKGAKGCTSLVSSTGTALAIMQRYRPVRLLAKEKWVGCSMPRGKALPLADDITDITYVGEQEVIALETSTHTLISEGLCQHNSDIFDKQQDKSRMETAPLYEMTQYGGGDTDACLRLAKVLFGVLKQDSRNFGTYLKVQMPCLNMLVKMERNGVYVDKEALRDLHAFMVDKEATDYSDLIRMVHPKIKREFLLNHKVKNQPRKALSFSRAVFLQAILFRPKKKGGRGLKPKVWTASTAELPMADRIPSVSVNTHLPYFAEDAFVQKYIEYSALNKMLTTYVGNEEANTGFWQHIKADGKIHPSFNLSTAVTGRCLVGNTIVATVSGGKRIDEVRVGDTVLTHDCNFKPVTKVFDNGVRDVYTVRTACGKSITATPEHKMLTRSGWVMVKDLSVGSNLTVDSRDFSVASEAGEEWRDTCHPDYTVSSNGRVLYAGHKTIAPRYVKPHRKGLLGHVKVNLGCRKSPIGRECGVHVLVAEAFLPPRPYGCEVMHVNGMAGDNRASNLRWGTSKDNADMMVSHGRSRRGNRHSQTDLTLDTVADIRRLRTGGATYVKIHEHFPDVSERRIGQICRLERYLDPITPFGDSAVVSVTYAGKEHTYDICVEDDHSFIGNNIVTHNSSSRSPNGQNIPKRGSLAKPFRKVLKAGEGRKFVSCDLSQAELRIAACMADERTMIALYASGTDLHAATAAMAMGIDLEDFWLLPKDERKKARQGAKAVNFGFIYGMWWKSFKVYAKTTYGVEYTDAEAKNLRDRYFKEYSGLLRWHKRAHAFVHRNKYVRSLHGALRRLRGIDSEMEGMVKKAERDSVNSPVQRFGSDLGLIAMTALVRDCPPDEAKPALFIHDDNTLDVREDLAEDYASYLKYYMENPPLKEMFDIELPVPIVADAEIGDNLGEMEEYPDMLAVRPPWYVGKTR